MNIRELTYVALKITGIFCLLMGIWIFGVTLNTVTLLIKEMPYAELYFLANLIPFVSSMLVAFLLLSQTNRVISWLSLPEDDGNQDAIKVEAFLSAAFAIVAVVLFINGVSKLVTVPHFIQAYLTSIDSMTGQRYPMLLSSSIHSVAEIFIKIVLGLYLFFGGDGLIRFWKRYREKKMLID